MPNMPKQQPEILSSVQSCPGSKSIAIVKGHLDDCDLVSIGCPNAGCNETVLRRDAVEQRGLRPMELVQCDHCQKDMARRELASHISLECIGRRKQPPTPSVRVSDGDEALYRAHVQVLGKPWPNDSPQQIIKGLAYSVMANRK
eukprot:gene6334-7060_t